MNKELPVKIQIIVYRKDKNGTVKILLLKRTLEDGGFWQTVTGTLEINESILDARKRELEEETGIREVVRFTNEIYRFSWQKKDYTVVELVFGAEVSSDKVKLSQEHTEYAWLSYKDAIDIVEKENTKKSLEAFQNLVMSGK